MMRGSVTSLVRTWPSTIMRRAAAKSVMLRIPRACERRLLAASGGKRQGTEYASSARPRESGDPDLGSGFPLEFIPRESGGGNERSFAVVGSLRQRLPAGSRSCIAGLAKRAANGYFASDIRAPQGHVAEWLRNGLQNRVPRFNSGRGLQINQPVGSSAAAPNGLAAVDQIGAHIEGEAAGELLVVARCLFFSTAVCKQAAASCS